MTPEVKDSVSEVKEELTCTVCGTLFEGVWDRNDSPGTGCCTACEVWARGVFFGARIKVLMEKLSPENQAKFRAMSRKKKEVVVVSLIESGAMI